MGRKRDEERARCTYSGSTIFKNSPLWLGVSQGRFCDCFLNSRRRHYSHTRTHTKISRKWLKESQKDQWRELRGVGEREKKKKAKGTLK